MTTVSPINHKKINALSQAYENLPKNGFSKLIVTLCMFCGIISIIVSFIFLYIGIDASSLLVASLGFFGSELVVLGARTLFHKEESKDDLIIEEIRNELNDGKLYNSKGEIVALEDEYVVTNDINDVNMVTETVTTNTFTETTTVTETTETSTEEQPKKKRGRPKKDSSTSVATESKPKNNYKLNGENIELTSSYMSTEQDGRD